MLSGKKTKQQNKKNRTNAVEKATQAEKELKTAKQKSNKAIKSASKKSYSSAIKKLQNPTHSKHKGCTTEKCWALLETQGIRKSLKKQREEIQKDHSRKQTGLKARYEKLYKEYPVLRPKKPAKPKVEWQRVACQAGYNDCLSTIYTYPTRKKIVTIFGKRKPKGVADGCNCSL
jgi:hypothetical protein